jgi:succinoglycan biosynthesis protein ExoV
MQLFYYSKSIPNFGDDLNAVLWPNLVPELLDDDSEVGFVGIGTIIGMPCGGLRRLHVFSSGVGNNQPHQWSDREVRYWCVRGPISVRMLGLPEDAAITDGAILTPLVKAFPDSSTQRKGTVIVPHWQTLDYPGWDEVAVQTGFDLLDPRGDPRQVIPRIAQAQLVLTESLHGAIIADTYGVPWIAFMTSKNFGITKWVDWTLSIGRSFQVTLVPPPDPGPILAHGRRSAPYGRPVLFGAEEALAEFQTRFTPMPDKVGSRLKAMLKRSHLLRPFLGFSPARTASAMEQLSHGEATLSAASLREELQSRMLERLSALSAYHRGNSSPLSSRRRY